MKLAFLLTLLLPCFFVKGQLFNGWWTGAITREFNNETRTDSISFRLEQKGNRLTGYSLLQVDSIHFIKAAIKGDYIASNRMLRLTEVSVEELNIPGSDEEIFLDSYLFSFDTKEMNQLSGKSIPRENRQSYGRSKIIIHRK